VRVCSELLHFSFIHARLSRARSSVRVASCLHRPCAAAANPAAVAAAPSTRTRLRTLVRTAAPLSRCYRTRGPGLASLALVHVPAQLLHLLTPSPYAASSCARHRAAEPCCVATSACPAFAPVPTRSAPPLHSRPHSSTYPPVRPPVLRRAPPSCAHSGRPQSRSRTPVPRRRLLPRARERAWPARPHSGRPALLPSACLPSLLGPPTAQRLRSNRRCARWPAPHCAPPARARYRASSRGAALPGPPCAASRPSRRSGPASSRVPPAVRARSCAASLGRCSSRARAEPPRLAPRATAAAAACCSGSCRQPRSHAWAAPHRPPSESAEHPPSPRLPRLEKGVNGKRNRGRKRKRKSVLLLLPVGTGYDRDVRGEKN
jgi:hypothetical protein